MFAQAAQAALDAQQNREDEPQPSSRQNAPRSTTYRRGVTLDQLRPGECGTVRRLLGPTQGRLRLLEMGMTVGTHVRVLRTAAFGGPVDVLLRGYQLSLRRDEAACIYLDDPIDES